MDGLYKFITVPLAPLSSNNSRVPITYAIIFIELVAVVFRKLKVAG